MTDTRKGTLPNILHFAPRLYSMIWGGNALAAFKGVETDLENVGESWDISAVPGKESVVDCGPCEGLSLTELAARFGEKLLGTRSVARYGLKFPLLVKLIDAAADLSIQVHPTDELAAQRHNSLGKTEMWYVIDTRPGAVIKAGLSEALTPDDYRIRVANGTFASAVASYESKPGDSFFIPAGRVHAICAGNLLAEIQESSDITYRIFDYNRRDSAGNLRQLHTAEAADAIDYTVLPDYRNTPRHIAPGRDEIVRCEHFAVEHLTLDGSTVLTIDPRGESFAVLMCLSGEADITCGDERLTLPAGDTVLLSAGAPAAHLTGHASLLAASV